MPTDKIFLNNGYVKSAFAHSYGHVHALQVSAGEYYFDLGVQNLQVRYEKPRLADFRIEPGEIKYVGDVGVEGCGTIRVTIADRWSQVRAKFIESYPKLDLRQVKIELIRRAS